MNIMLRLNLFPCFISGNPSGSHWNLTKLKVAVAQGSFVILMPRWLKSDILCVLCTMVFCTVKWIKDRKFGCMGHKT